MPHCCAQYNWRRLCVEASLNTLMSNASRIASGQDPQDHRLRVLRYNHIMRWLCGVRAGALSDMIGKGSFQLLSK